jgi:carbonic anhydrase
MSQLDALLEANRDYAQRFAQGGLPGPPARRLAVLTCMDARLDPQAFLGLTLGDAHVIRNAGGRASDDAIRSLVISSELLGTREFLVIHHTACGMQSFTNQELRRRLQESRGADAFGVDFLPFGDPAQSVHDDVRRILASPLLAPEIVVSGWLYDVRTGRLEQVVAPAAKAGTTS